MLLNAARDGERDENSLNDESFAPGKIDTDGLLAFWWKEKLISYRLTLPYNLLKEK